MIASTLTFARYLRDRADDLWTRAPRPGDPTTVDLLREAAQRIERLEAERASYARIAHEYEGRLSEEGLL